MSKAELADSKELRNFIQPRAQIILQKGLDPFIGASHTGKVYISFDTELAETFDDLPDSGKVEICVRHPQHPIQLSKSTDKAIVDYAPFSQAALIQQFCSVPNITDALTVLFEESLSYVILNLANVNPMQARTSRITPGAQSIINAQTKNFVDLGGFDNLVQTSIECPNYFFKHIDNAILTVFYTQQKQLLISELLFVKNILCESKTTGIYFYQHKLRVFVPATQMRLSQYQNQTLEEMLSSKFAVNAQSSEPQPALDPIKQFENAHSQISELKTEIEKLKTRVSFLEADRDSLLKEVETLKPKPAVYFQQTQGQEVEIAAEASSDEKKLEENLEVNKKFLFFTF
jgi:hypothetical protein